MRRIGSQVLVPACIAIAGALAAASCAGPPPRHAGDRDADEGTRGDAVLMTAVVVDTIGASGTLTVKDLQDHETWTITTNPQTRIYGANGGRISLTDIEIGARIQVQGDSRLPMIVEAGEIAVQDVSPPRRAPEPLPR